MSAYGSVYNKSISFQTINADDLAVDSPTLVVDEINNRLGIGLTDPDSTVEVLSTSTQQKWSYDANSFATLTVADASHTTIATGESGDLILDAADDIILDSHLGKWRFKRNDTMTCMVSTTSGDASSMVFDHQISDADYVFKVSDGGVGTTAMTIDGSDAGHLRLNASVSMKEQAAALGDTAAYGQLWVKTATPNQLYFTTDAGDDIQLTSGTATAFVGDITGVTAGTGLSGGGTTGALTVNLDSNSLTEAAIANGDYIMFNDATDSSAPKREALADLVTLLAGTASSTGLSASSSVLSVSDLHPVGVDGAANQLLTDDGDGTVSSEGNLSFDGSTLVVTGALTTTTTATVGSDLTVTGGDIAFGATNSTLTVGATAHDAAGASLAIAAGGPTAGTSNNQAGGNLTISAGQGKGSSPGGGIIFQIAPSGGSGSSLNSLAAALSVEGDGKIKVGSGVTADTVLYFDGNAQDYRIGIDDGTDSLEIGHGTAHGTNTALSINNSGQLTTINMPAAAVAVADDHIMILDGGATGAPKAESIADLVAGIASTGLDASSGVLTVDVSDFMANGANNYLVTATGTDAQNAEANLQFDGTGLKIKEAAAAAADTAAYGQVWVKNTTPAELWFTDDTGTDIQITAGGTAAPSGVEVHLGEAVGASLVVCGVAIDSGKISVNKAIPTNLNKCRGPFFVTDASGSSGDIVTVLERKIVTGIDTSGKAVGDPVYLHTDGTATFTRPGVTADDAAFNFIMIIGRILKIHGSDGAYVLEPKGLESQPLMGQVAAGGGTSTLVTGFAGYADVPVIAMINEADPVPGDDDQIKSAFVRAADGKLQITIDAGSANYSPYTYMIFF